VCVGDNCALPLGGASSVSVVSESVAEWWDAPGRCGEGDGWLLLAGAVETLVRQENLSEPGAWGELGGTGTRGMKTFGGKRGDRRRMYHPRKGRCISHSTVEFALSCNSDDSQQRRLRSSLSGRTTTCSTISLSIKNLSYRIRVRVGLACGYDE